MYSYEPYNTTLVVDRSNSKYPIRQAVEVFPDVIVELCLNELARTFSVNGTPVPVPEGTLEEQCECVGTYLISNNLVESTKLHRVAAKVEVELCKIFPWKEIERVELDRHFRTVEHSTISDFFRVGFKTYEGMWVNSPVYSAGENVIMHYKNTHESPSASNG